MASSTGSLVVWVQFCAHLPLHQCVRNVFHDWGVLFGWCPSAAGPAVAQLLPNVVGRLVKLSVALPDPTDVLEVLQDSSVASLTLIMSHLIQMVWDCVSNCLMHVVKCSFLVHPSHSLSCASLSADST